MRRSKWQFVFTILLIVFSIFAAVRVYPAGAWLVGACMGAVAFASLVLRVGWVVPCTVAGVYAGLIMDSDTGSGTIDSQMIDTVTSICVGALFGFLIGFAVDAK